MGKTERKKIKILYICDNSQTTGGGERQLLNVIRNLDREQFHPVVVLPEEGPLRNVLESLDVKVHISALSDYWWYSQTSCYKFLSALKERIRGIVDVVYEEEIDIVHSNSIYKPDGAFAAGITNKPHIWHIRNIFKPADAPIFECFPYQSMIGELSDRVITVSNAVKESITEYVSSNKIEVIYDGIELKDFSHANLTRVKSIKKELGIPLKTELVCSIGRIDSEKGFDCYIEAASQVFKKHKDIRFLLVGPEQDKTLYKSLKKQVEDFGLENIFFFLGQREDVAGILSETDI